MGESACLTMSKAGSVPAPHIHRQDASNWVAFSMCPVIIGLSGSRLKSGEEGFMLCLRVRIIGTHEKWVPF